MNWIKALDSVLGSYGYPKKPCDGGCVENCPNRSDCPLFLAWTQRQTAERANMLDEAEKDLKEIKEVLDGDKEKPNQVRVEAELVELKKWWDRFELQINPDTYGGDEIAIRRAIGRCTWKAALAFVLAEIDTGYSIKDIEDRIRDELRGTK